MAEKYYLATCVDPKHKSNIEKGVQYLLIDKWDRGTHFHVYVKRINQYYGCYKREYFGGFKEITKEEAEGMMEFPVNIRGMANNSTPPSHHDATQEAQEGTNAGEGIVKPVKTGESHVKKPDKENKVSKPIQKSLFG